MTPRSLRIPVALHLEGPHGLVPLPEAYLRYRQLDPHAVVVELHTSTDARSWHLDRNQVIAALDLDLTDEPIGMGDVRIGPSSDGQSVTVELCSSSGRARVLIPRQELVAMIEQTLALVALGQEHTCYDLDAELAALCGGAYS